MKRVLITDAGTEIDKAVALAISKRGHYVYAKTHTKDQAISLNKIAKKKHLSLKSFKLDILSSINRSISRSLKN